jgi:electron transfer flavoprotein alpha subunit
MTSLVLAEHDNGRLNEATGKVLSGARALGGDVHVLVAGKGAAAVAAEAAALAGVSKVLLAQADTLEYALAEPLAALIVGLAGPYDAIVAAATTTGKNVMPRVAALLDVMQVSDVIEVLGPDTFRRPIYAGNALQTVRATDAKKVLTLRSSSFPAAEAGGAAAPVETVAAAPDPGLSAFVENRLSHTERPELASAKIIISGGGRWGPRTSSWRSCCPSPTRSARRWAPPARRWMPAMRRMTGRSARPERSSPPTFTSPAAFQAPSSTWPA